MFSLARELAEGRGELRQLPHLKLYADWTLHPELRWRLAQEVLDRVREVTERHWEADSNQLVPEISKILSLKSLRAQLLQLFRSDGLPTSPLEDDRVWSGIATLLLRDLLGKPLVGSEFTEEEQRTGVGRTPRRLRLKQHRKTGMLMWEIALGPRVTFSGELWAM
ncbi:MAG TPA: hypothetical protein VMP01_28310 [Pirellulaceae bacterium]|nr:hypothetical protein [Pirellulaceae bacterium]